MGACGYAGVPILLRSRSQSTRTSRRRGSVGDNKVCNKPSALQLKSCMRRTACIDWSNPKGISSFACRFLLSTEIG